MNILIINHYVGSPDLGMEYRPYYIAREWVRSGHRVRIVGASYSHLRTKNPNIQGSLNKETLDEIDYIWLKTPSYSGNGFGRMLNMLIFIVKLYRYQAKITNRFVPDMVISSSTYPLDNYPGYRIAKRYGAQFVYEVHDIWPLSPMEIGGYSKYNPYIMIMQAAENFAYRHCHKVISLLPYAEPHMREHGLSVGKFAYIPNGINSKDWIAPAPLPVSVAEAIKKFRNNRFLVGYAGGHGLSNALDYLVEAARLVPEIAFILVGSGTEKDRLRLLARGLDNVLFLDPLPKQTVPSFLQVLDATYIGWTRSPLYRYGISPNKLFDYMMAGKPVVHAVDAANDPCAEAASGYCIPPENPMALADAFRRLASMKPKEREEMGQKGRSYVLAHHEYQIIAKDFLKAIF